MPLVLRLFLLTGPRGGLECLLARFTDMKPTPLGLEIPLDDRAPEEILALLLRHGITARATRIVDRPRSG
jgi:hypothetical protein